ncbi:MAG: MFS transporter [Deltaproteobacteria bacterium]|nr:MFS transporter [Deltaproteobacteria bacterium]
MGAEARAIRVLIATTLAFTVCFAVWMMYGVLVTFLVDAGVYDWSQAELGWLIGTPVLTGAILRLPAGVLTDRFGGRVVMTGLLLLTSVPVYFVSHTNSYTQMLVAGLGVGLSGASFAVGVGYVSLWFRPERQGMVLGVFGMGNTGAALTNMIAPRILDALTRGGTSLDAWRMLPKFYAAMLVVTAIAFWLCTDAKKIEGAKGQSLSERLAPLRLVRVWRFGLYYAFMFGSFVALSQWLLPYYVNVYSTSVATAGLLAAVFSLPSGVVRVLGGWASDKVGARTVLFWTLGASLVLLALLFPPRVELQAPGQGIIAARAGTVSSVSDHEVVVDDDRYVLEQAESSAAQVRFGIHHDSEGFLFLPTASFHQTPIVRKGDQVVKGQLLVRGVTRVYFQANRLIFTTLVLLLGVTMGLGSAAVFKLIPSYFPENVGVVGGAVGTLGALGGFVFPIFFGYLLAASGIWTTNWMLLAVVAIVCLVWLRVTVQRLER